MLRTPARLFGLWLVGAVLAYCFVGATGGG